MPYVPSEKTDGKSQDRKLIDAKVEVLAAYIASQVSENIDLLKEYKRAFDSIARRLAALFEGGSMSSTRTEAQMLADTIWEVGKTYPYQLAFLGELNYAITRLIQRVPQLLVKEGLWEAKSELRYWLYAVTTEALTYASFAWQGSPMNLGFGLGLAGVFEDIKDEYKRRVNTAYEAAQILKSGDCYDTPYYTRLIKVVDPNGNLIGHQEVMLARSKETVGVDLLNCVIVAQNPGA